MTDSIKVNGTEIEYIRFGSGERAFVIFPGLGTKSITQSAMVIEASYSRFTDEYPVWVFDRGRDLPEGCSVRQMASDIADAMTALGISGADIFGASMGGMIAMCMAIDHPELVRRVVFGSTSSRMDNNIVSSIDRWIELAERGDVTNLTADFLDNLFSKDTVGKYRDFLIHINDGLTQSDIDRFIIQAKAITKFDVYDELDKITCPALVIGVEGDKVLPVEYSREIAEKIGCELYLYGSEYAHCVFDEAPDYKQRLLDFYNKTI